MPNVLPAPPRLMSDAAAGVQPVEPGKTVCRDSPPFPQVQAGPCAPAPRTASPRSVTEPLTADLHRLHVTVSTRFMRKLEAARDALSHSHPGADAEAILEAGLDLLIERTAKRKGLVAKPRPAQRPPSCTAGKGRGEGESRGSAGKATGSRYIPAPVRREVWVRDEGRCQWPTADGGVCGSTRRVQYDHIVPVARGGESSAAGLRILCATHNDLAARQAFGDAWMDRFTGGAHRQPPHPAAPA